MPVAQGWCWRCHAEGSYWQSLTGQSGDLACGEMTLRKVTVMVGAGGSSSRVHSWLQPQGTMMGKVLPAFLGGPMGLMDQLPGGWGGEQGVGPVWLALQTPDIQGPTGQDSSPFPGPKSKSALGI